MNFWYFFINAINDGLVEMHAIFKKKLQYSHTSIMLLKSAGILKQFFFLKYNYISSLLFILHAGFVPYFKKLHPQISVTDWFPRQLRTVIGRAVCLRFPQQLHSVTESEFQSFSTCVLCHKISITSYNNVVSRNKFEPRASVLKYVIVTLE